MKTKREFLKTSALALSGVAAAAPLIHSGAQGAEMTGILKKGVKFSMLKEPDLSTVDQFKLLKEVGFHGTELRTENNTDYKTYREAVDKSDFPVHGIVNSDKPDLETAVKFASDIGGDSVLYVARYDKKRPLMESWDETIAVIRKGLPAAEKHEVKILVENVWAGFLISALDMERYVDEINHPWFGAYYDVGNNVRWGVPQHWIEILGDRIGKLDIKEWDEKKHASEGLRQGFGSELGDGTIDWAAVRASIRKIGFKGWATAEVGGGDRERLAEISRRMDTVLGLV
ncbi:MAG: sugar phosphate isomerase/epimerase [Verrucomicrobiales bacterium]|nr:sugar phosphate isomerase/epimerase [Verrucomicrobiales bacterium]